MELTEYFRKIFAYQNWANQNMLAAAAKLSSEQLHYSQGHSWGSIFGTLVHMLDAEWIWVQRLKGISPKSQGNFAGLQTMEDLENAWQQQSRETTGFLAALQESDFDRIVAYTNTKGASFSQPMWQILSHLSNHETHHRGELAAMFALMQAEHPEDEMIGYFRDQRTAISE